jgi:hypothetical protein
VPLFSVFSGKWYSERLSKGLETLVLFFIEKEKREV